MKVFIFFMLVGLSLCDGDSSDSEECLAAAPKLDNEMGISPEDFCTLLQNKNTQECLNSLTKKLNDRSEKLADRSEPTNLSQQAQAADPCQGAVNRAECLNNIVTNVIRFIEESENCIFRDPLRNKVDDIILIFEGTVEKTLDCLIVAVERALGTILTTSFATNASGGKGMLGYLQTNLKPVMRTAISLKELLGGKNLADVVPTAQCVRKDLMEQELLRSVADLMGNGSCCNKGSGLSNLLCNDKDQLPMKDVLETVICINKGAKIPNKQINDWVNAIGVMPLEDFLENLKKMNGITCPAKPSENETTS